MIAVILMACYMNPDVNIITIINNHIRLTSAATFSELWDANKDKIHELNLSGAIVIGEVTEYFVGT